MKLKTMIPALAIAILALSLGSCKKDWTCTCSVNGAAFGSETISNVTKKDATTACNQNIVSVAGFSSDCSLKAK